MKYVMTWRERAWGSAADAEAAQERVLEIRQHWTPPVSITLHQFLVRLGEYGGFAVLETDDLESLHQLASTFAVFEFVIHPVIEVGMALAAEGAAVAWRHSMAAS
jgi:muconolactone delta-isomerase